MPALDFLADIPSDLVTESLSELEGSSGGGEEGRTLSSPENDAVWRYGGHDDNDFSLHRYQLEEITASLLEKALRGKLYTEITNLPYAVSVLYDYVQ